VRRHSIFESFILRLVPSGDAHGRLLLLCREETQIWVQAYGVFGPKSRLKASCQAFNKIKAYVYFDSVKQGWRLEEAEILADASVLKADLSSIYLASFFSELWERMPLPPNEAWVFELFSEALEVLLTETLRPFCLALFIQVLWRVLSYQGFQEELAELLIQKAPEALKYLQTTFAMPLQEAVQIIFASRTNSELALFLGQKMEELLGFSLRSLKNASFWGL